MDLFMLLLFLCMASLNQGEEVKCGEVGMFKCDNGRCVKMDGQCYDTNCTDDKDETAVLHTCVQCAGWPCTGCGKADMCNKCEPGYSLYEEVDEYGVSYCKKCSDSCKLCDSPSVCTECHPYYGLRDGHCEQCDSKDCKHCDEPGICNECAPGYILKDGKCYKMCDKFEFKCALGECISKHDYCDRSPDCENEADEQNCIDVTYVSDNVNGTCSNNEETEETCKSVAASLDVTYAGLKNDATYPAGCFVYKNSEVYFNSRTQTDVKCMRDARVSTCRADDFKCTEDGKCIPGSWRCDKFADCDYDGMGYLHSSDEQNCPATCKDDVKGATYNGTMHKAAYGDDCIPWTDMCKEDVKGVNYKGTKQKTTDGQDCVTWPEDSDGTFPDGSVAAAKNYCRNPDGDDGGPWCWFGSGDDDWHYCDITICDPGTFPDGSVAAAKNYCRNPDGDDGGPWCWLSAEEWNSCDIPICDPACSTINKDLDCMSRIDCFWDILADECKELQR